MNRLIFMRLYYVYFKFLFKNRLDHLNISLKIVLLLEHALLVLLENVTQLEVILLQGQPQCVTTVK